MALLIVGVTEDGAAAFSAPLDHGADPDTVVFDQGYQALRPLEADWQGADLAPAPAGPSAGAVSRGPEPLPPRTDAGLIITDDVVPVTRQRVAAYAVVLSRRGLLATEYSTRRRCRAVGACPAVAWTTTSRRRCVRREVNEETAQQIVLGELTKVQTGHWIGRNPGGMIEDFHAVRLIYRATCPSPTRPGRAGPRRQHRLRPLGRPRRLDAAGLDGQLDDDPERAASRRRRRELCARGRRGSPPLLSRLTSLSRSCRVSTPTGFPSSSTSSASPSTSTSTAFATGSVAPTIGSEASITVLTRSAGRDPTGEQRPEQPALADRADHLGRHHRRFGPHHRHLAHPVLAQDRHRLGDGLARVGVHQRRQRAGLLPQHVTHHPLGWCSAGRSRSGSARCR